MTRHRGGSTIDQRGAPKPTADEAAIELDIADNVAAKGEKLSPSDCERDETSGMDEAAPVDIEAHERAS